MWHTWGKRNARRDLVGKTEEKRRLERLRLRWEVNTEMDPKEMEWEGVDWIHLADVKNKWRALLNTLMKFGFHKIRRSSWVINQTTDFWKGILLVTYLLFIYLFIYLLVIARSTGRVKCICLHFKLPESVHIYFFTILLRNLSSESVL